MDDEPTYDAFTGNRAHKVTQQQAEDLFVEAVSAAAGREPVFVVVGTGEREEFTDRLSELAAVVVDRGIGDAALIVSGDPDDWETLRELIVPPAELL